MSTPRDDDDVRVSAAWREATAGDDGPPPALDDAIRAAARRAVAAGPRGASPAWLKPAWIPRLAAAAVVVLSTSVVMLAIEEDPALKPAVVTTSLDTKIIEPAPVMEQAMVEPAKPAPPSTPAAAPPPAQAKKEKRDAAPESRRQAAPSRPAVPEVQVAARDNVAAPVYAPPPPPAAPPAVAYAPTPAPAPAREAPAAAVPQPFPSAAGEPARDRGVVAEMKLLAPATPAAPAAPAPLAAASALPAAQESRAPAVAANVAGMTARAKTESPAGARLDLAMQQARAESDAMKRLAKEGVDERPGPWLARLRALHAEGKMKELAAELERFARRHPHVVVPKELVDAARAVDASQNSGRSP